jgi:hypothetical protein
MTFVRSRAPAPSRGEPAGDRWAPTLGQQPPAQRVSNGAHRHVAAPEASACGRQELLVVFRWRRGSGQRPLPLDEAKQLLRPACRARQVARVVGRGSRCGPKAGVRVDARSGFLGPVDRSHRKLAHHGRPGTPDRPGSAAGPLICSALLRRADDPHRAYGRYLSEATGLVRNRKPLGNGRGFWTRRRDLFACGRATFSRRQSRHGRLAGNVGSTVEVLHRCSS